jgi:pyruvate kinase
MVRAASTSVRLNFSHGTADDHLARAALVKEIAARPGARWRSCAICRARRFGVGKFKNGMINLQKGQNFVLDAGCELGDGDRAGLDYKELPRDVGAGSVLLLDDGKIVLDVTQVRGEEVHTKVRHGGVLLEQQGHQPAGRRAHGAALHAEGHRRHPHRGEDQRRLSRGLVPQDRRRHVHGARTAARLRRQGLPDRQDRARGGGDPGALVDIMNACDGIMVARGDLAVEVGDARCRRCRSA